MTDEVTYQKTLNSIPGVESGKGRAFVYIPKGGPDVMSTMGVIDFFSIDDTIFRFGGESYFYIDIDAGSHHVTVTEVVKAGLRNTKQYGKNKIEIFAPEGDVIYLRITPQKARVYTVEVVSKSIAEREMENLSLWTNSATTMKIE